MRSDAFVCVMGSYSPQSSTAGMSSSRVRNSSARRRKILSMAWTTSGSQVFLPASSAYTRRLHSDLPLGMASFLVSRMRAFSSVVRAPGYCKVKVLSTLTTLFPPFDPVRADSAGVRSSLTRCRDFGGSVHFEYPPEYPRGGFYLLIESSHLKIRVDLMDVLARGHGLAEGEPHSTFPRELTHTQVVICPNRLSSATARRKGRRKPTFLEFVDLQVLSERFRHM